MKNGEIDNFLRPPQHALQKGKSFLGPAFDLILYMSLQCMEHNKINNEFFDS